MARRERQRLRKYSSKLSPQEKAHNARYAAAKYRSKLKDKGYVHYTRFVPKEIKSEIRSWVNSRIARWEDTGE